MDLGKNYSKINDQFDKRLKYMMEKHNKVTFGRFDPRFPEDYIHDGTNSELSDLLKSLKEKLTRNGVEMRYVWCREKNTSENPHYHVAFLVNGSHIQNVGGILQDASDIWGRITESKKEGLIDYCSTFDGKKVPRQIRIDRPSSVKEGEELKSQQRKLEENTKKVLQRAHYLGKNTQKGNVPKRVREFGASELPEQP